MKVEKLIIMAERRLAALYAARSAAELAGDVDSVTRADTEITEVQITLDKLRNIQPS